MKKAFLLLLIALIGNIKAQDWVEFSASESTEPAYTITQSDNSLVQFEINVPGMYSTLIDSLNRVNIKDHRKTDSIGLPELPVVSFLVAIPCKLLTV